MQKPHPKLTIVIVNYNTRKLILDCLESIKKSQSVEFGINVIVIDNASTDDSVKYLDQIKWITLIKNSQNSGFSSANNLAIPHITSEYVWFLNPDTVVEPKTISHMVQYMDLHPQVGIASPKLILPDGSFDRNCHRGFPSPWNSFCHFSGLSQLFPKSKLFSGYYLGHLSDKVESPVDCVGGSSVLTRTSIMHKVGWWDTSFFMYGEDIALSWEVKQLGFKVMYVPDVIIHHYHGAASGIKKTSQYISSADKSTKLRSISAGTDAMKIFYLKYYQDKYPKIITYAIIATISLLSWMRKLKLIIHS